MMIIISTAIRLITVITSVTASRNCALDTTKTTAKTREEEGRDNTTWSDTIKTRLRGVANEREKHEMKAGEVIVTKSDSKVPVLNGACHVRKK